MRGEHNKEIENIGWDNMKGLLDQHMPVRRNNWVPFLWIFGSLASVFTIVWFVFSINSNAKIEMDSIEKDKENTTVNLIAEHKKDAKISDQEEGNNGDKIISEITISDDNLTISKNIKSKPTFSDNHKAIDKRLEIQSELIAENDKINYKNSKNIENTEFVISNERIDYAQDEALLRPNDQLYFNLLPSLPVNKFEINRKNYLDEPNYKLVALPNIRRGHLFAESGYLGPLLKANHGIYLGLGYRYYTNNRFVFGLGVQYAYSTFRNSYFFDFEAERASNDPSSEITDAGTSIDNNGIISITDEKGIKTEYYTSAIDGIKNFQQISFPILIGYQINPKNNIGIGFNYNRIINLNQSFNSIQGNQSSFNLNYSGLVQNSLSQNVYNINNVGLSLNYEYSLTNKISINLAFKSNLLPIIKSSNPSARKDLFTTTSLGLVYKL